MTQEEKAKAYDEAIEKINGCSTDKYGCLLGVKPSDIFPQLKESEDERIRKWLIDYFDKVNDEIIKEDRLKIIAYLEKQKDAGKAIEAVERIDKYIDERTANAHDMDDSNPDKKYYSGVDDTLSNIAGILNSAYSEEKQKEQKPAESIPRLTVQGKGVYKICPRCKERMVRDDSQVYASVPPQYGYKCPKCGEMEFDTVMYDNPEIEEQKPVEWDFPYGVNETVDKLIAIAECLEMDGDCLFNGYSGTECGKFLRELARKQIGCKPMEWGEGEKKVLDTIIDDYEKAAKSFCGYDGKIMLLKAIRDGEYDLSKQGWSEEDEKTSYFIKQFLEYHSNDPTAHSCINWLKALKNRVLTQQKPEWSKEDEDTYKRVYSLFEQATDEWCDVIFKGCYPKITREKVLSMLKSLHPVSQ